MTPPTNLKAGMNFNIFPAWLQNIPQKKNLAGDFWGGLAAMLLYKVESTAKPICQFILVVTNLLGDLGHY